MTPRKTPAVSRPAPDGAKPPRRLSEVSPELRSRLNSGEVETRNLVEWLAIDQAALVDAVLAELKLSKSIAAAVSDTARRVAASGVLERVSTIGAAWGEAVAATSLPSPEFKAIASHRSDTVRIWAAYATVANSRMSLARRLTAIRPFAADAHFGVRECAWMAVRGAILNDVEQAIELLIPWTADDDANIRRFAIEATRPCGVWCPHITQLKRDPSPGTPLLDAVRGDPSRYVQTSAGNWLNDASKSQPDWVRDLCQRWSRESREPATTWIVKHALRTLNKSKST